MKTKKYLVFWCILLMTIGCSKEKYTEVLMNVSETPYYSVQFGENKDIVEVYRAMVVKEDGTDVEQHIEMGKIKNFTYERGNEYLLRVNKTSNDRYSLKEIVSKTLINEIETIVIYVTTEMLPIGEDGKLMERMIVKEEGEEEPSTWLPYSFKIEGFKNEKGFDYRLKVKKLLSECLHKVECSFSLYMTMSK